MTRTLLALPLLAALLVSGCSSSDDEPAADPTPARPASSAPSASPSPSPTAGPDPVKWYSSGRTCTELDGPLLTSELFRVKRPLALTGVALKDSTGDITLGKATYVAKPKGEVTSTGGWRGTAPSRKEWDRIGWRDRQPIAGAQVEPGFYYVFLPLTVSTQSGYDGVNLIWTDDDGATGTSVWGAQDTFREHCR